MSWKDAPYAGPRTFVVVGDLGKSFKVAPTILPSPPGINLSLPSPAVDSENQTPYVMPNVSCQYGQQFMFCLQQILVHCDEI